MIIILIVGVFQISDRAQTKFFSFLSPLAFEIWFYIAFGYVFVSICIWIVARLSPIEWVNSKPPCSMACDHILREIQKENCYDEQLELTHKKRLSEHDEEVYLNSAHKISKPNDYVERDDTLCGHGTLPLPLSNEADEDVPLLSSMKIGGVTGLGGLWALKWAWQTFFWVNR